MSEGFMTEADAERAIWAYFWQLDNHQDRRGAPLITEPPDTISEEEAIRIRESQTSLMAKMNLKYFRLLKEKSKSSSLARVTYAAVMGGAKKLGKFLSPGQRDYLKSLMQEAEEEVYEEGRKKTEGSVDPNTGLPYNEYDLTVGRAVVSGRELCMEAIIPPDDLALASTTWLPPEDGVSEANNSPEWGSSLSHWQALAFKEKDKQCVPCVGRGVIQKKLARATSTLRNIIVREAPKFYSVRCDHCGGRGSFNYWDDDEVKAIKHNTRLIGEKVSELAHEGYFNERPIDSHDVEMGDLVWKNQAGLTLGFRLTPDGYEHMKEYCSEDDELQQVLHVLALSGKHVRDTAPDWAQRDYHNAKPVTVGGLGGAPESLAEETVADLAESTVADLD